MEKIKTMFTLVELGSCHSRCRYSSPAQLPLAVPTRMSPALFQVPYSPRRTAEEVVITADKKSKGFWQRLQAMPETVEYMGKRWPRRALYPIGWDFNICTETPVSTTSCIPETVLDGVPYVVSIPFLSLVRTLPYDARPGNNWSWLHLERCFTL